MHGNAENYNKKWNQQYAAAEPEQGAKRAGDKSAGE
jgi:hypothetical protein